jgi:uncharacterized protein (DUF433 family)
MSAQLTQHRIDLAKTSLGKSAPAYPWEEVYFAPEIGADLKVYNQGGATIYYFKIGPKYEQVSYWNDVDLTTVFSHPVVQTDASGSLCALSQRLCEEHPAISTYGGIFGGVPHLNGLRISVADILEQLYLTGSIAGVEKIYSPDVSEDQIKEAIAYAQDFLESALSSSS